VNTHTSNASLIIHPNDPEWSPDKTATIISSLKDIELIAEALPNEKHAYMVGEHFLEQISFMGCSPNINLVPQDNAEKFCCIKLITKPGITALTSQHTHAPHCPHCKKPEKNWSDTITDTSLLCSSCGQTSSPWHYNWRKSAGFGHFFIEITEIYPKEAIPQPELLSSLEQRHGTSWAYFYLHY
jgi:hypothetical protein